MRRSRIGAVRNLGSVLDTLDPQPSDVASTTTTTTTAQVDEIPAAAAAATVDEVSTTAFVKVNTRRVERDGFRRRVHLNTTVASKIKITADGKLPRGPNTPLAAMARAYSKESVAHHFGCTGVIFNENHLKHGVFYRCECNSFQMAGDVISEMERDAYLLATVATDRTVSVSVFDGASNVPLTSTHTVPAIDGKVIANAIQLIASTLSSGITTHVPMYTPVNSDQPAAFVECNKLMVAHVKEQSRGAVNSMFFRCQCRAARVFAHVV